MKLTRIMLTKKVPTIPMTDQNNFVRKLLDSSSSVTMIKIENVETLYIPKQAGATPTRTTEESSGVMRNVVGSIVVAGMRSNARIDAMIRTKKGMAGSRDASKPWPRKGIALAPKIKIDGAMASLKARTEKKAKNKPIKKMV